MGNFVGRGSFRNRLSLWLRHTPLWALLLHAAATTAIGQVPFVRVARTGDPVPGEPEATYYVVSPAGIDEAGNVAVEGKVQGPGLNGLNNNRVWDGTPSDQHMVFSAGPAPEYGPDAEFRTIYAEQYSGGGAFSFVADLHGEGIGDQFEVYLAGDPANLQPTLRRGTVPPGITDGLKLGSIIPTVGPTDFLGVSGRLYRDDSTDTVANGLWAGQPGNVRLVARSGAPAPGTGVSFTSSPVLAPNFTINRRGALAFPAFIEGPGIDQTNNAGIWAGTADDLALVARAGDHAPGTDAGVNFVGRPLYGWINANDHILFPSFLDGPGVDNSNNLGVWMGRAGESQQLVARNGDPVPLLGDAYTTTDFFPFFLTDQDRIAILETFTGPGVTPENDSAVFFGELGDFDMVLRDGEQAPGMSDGIVFDFDIDTPTLVFKDSGAMALEASLRGPGVDQANDRALFWRRTADDPLSLVAREGDLFDGGIIADEGILLRAGTGASGGPQSLNERGELLFGVGFAGAPDVDIGVYFVPAPPAALLLILGAVCGSRSILLSRDGTRGPVRCISSLDKEK